MQKWYSSNPPPPPNSIAMAECTVINSIPFVRKKLLSGLVKCASYIIVIWCFQVPTEPCTVEETDPVCPKPESDEFGKGVVFYRRNNVIVGILLWNTFNKMSIARKVSVLLGLSAPGQKSGFNSPLDRDGRRDSRLDAVILGFFAICSCLVLSRAVVHSLLLLVSWLQNHHFDTVSQFWGGRVRFVKVMFFQPWIPARTTTAHRAGAWAMFHWCRWVRERGGGEGTERGDNLFSFFFCINGLVGS